MTVRITYEHELEELNKDLREMAFMVEKAIEQTFVALRIRIIHLQKMSSRGIGRLMIWSGL